MKIVEHGQQDHFKAEEKLDKIERQLFDLSCTISRLQSHNSDDILSEVEARAFLKVSRKQLFNLRRRGKIGHYKVRRNVYFKRADLLRYMEDHFIPPIN